MAEKIVSKFKVLEQLGEPYHPDGVAWTKTTYRFEDVATSTPIVADTFVKNLKVDEIVEGDIEPTQWGMRFKRASTGTGYGGRPGESKEDAKLKRELSLRQTCLNGAVNIVTSLMPLATCEDGVFKFGKATFKISDLIGTYFDVFKGMLKTDTDKTVDAVKKVFDGEEIKDGEVKTD